MPWRAGSVTVTRIPDPGFELVLPQDAATTDLLRSTSWLHGWSLTDGFELRIGSSAVLVRSPDSTVLVDPWLAFDDPARDPGRLDALAAAGCEPDAVDAVVYSHVDGIGTVFHADGSPAFPNARHLVPAGELAAARDGHRPGADALIAFADAGHVEPVDGRTALDPAIVIEPLPGHTAAHAGVVVGDPPGAIVVGHLFLHPAQIANRDSVAGDEQPDVLRRTRDDVLARCCDDDLLLVAPLFAEPGAGRVDRDGDSYTLEPLAR
jgi:glyoxylase-like metal-dependent hydrolase (beta-lactamase superfamily II)